LNGSVVKEITVKRVIGTVGKGSVRPPFLIRCLDGLTIMAGEVPEGPNFGPIPNRPWPFFIRI
jgi:hypothetical protein